MNFQKVSLPVIGLMAALALTGCGQKSSGNLANVNGDSITMEEFYKHLETKPTVRAVVQGQSVEVPVERTLAFQALQDLVTQKLVLQIAKDQGFNPTTADIDKEVKFKEKLDPAYVEQLKARGLSMDQIRASITVDLAQEKILTKGIKITDKELDTFIKNNKSLFIKPAVARVMQVFANSEANKKKADDMLKNGQNFRDVATKINPSNVPVNSELNLSNMKRSAASQADVAKMYNLIMKTQEGQYTEWIGMQGGAIRYYIETRRAEEQTKIDEYKREAIKRDLAKARGAQATDLTSQIQKRLVAGRVTVTPKALQDLWKSFNDQVAREAK